MYLHAGRLEYKQTYLDVIKEKITLQFTCFTNIQAQNKFDMTVKTTKRLEVT